MLFKVITNPEGYTTRVIELWCRAQARFLQCVPPRMTISLATRATRRIHNRSKAGSRSNPDGGMSFVSDPKKPVGGHVLSKPSIIAIYHLQITKIPKQFCITPYCTLVPPSSLTSFSRRGARTDITGYSGAEKPFVPGQRRLCCTAPCGAQQRHWRSRLCTRAAPCAGNRAHG